VVKLLRTDTTLDLSQKARVVNCSERRSASYIGWLIRARAIAWSGYSELMSWSRNLKVMADFVPDFVPSTGLWCPPHTKTWILVFQFLIYMKRPVTRKRISPETQNQKNGMIDSNATHHTGHSNVSSTFLMELTLIFISVACEPHPSHQLLEWGVFADIFLPSLSTLSPSSEAYPYLRSSSIIISCSCRENASHPERHTLTGGPQVLGSRVMIMLTHLAEGFVHHSKLENRNGVKLQYALLALNPS